MTSAPNPMRDCLAQWHEFVATEGRDGDRLDELLHPDCVFYSPVVYTPQEGAAITKAYLEAASTVLIGDSDAPFTYRQEIVEERSAVLEFETKLNGTYVNGIDMISCDEHGKITEFKVMVRPLQAIEALAARMREALEG